MRSYLFRFITEVLVRYERRHCANDKYDMTVKYDRNRNSCILFSVLLGLMLFIGHANAAIPSITHDFAVLEAEELMPGGGTTAKTGANRHAFSHPSSNLSLEQGLNFKVGNGVFKKIWVSSPSSTTASDGLGPLYNARSCLRCHVNNGRGQPPTEGAENDRAVPLFLRLSIPPQTEAQATLLAQHRLGFIPEPSYGSQLQGFATQGVKAEGLLNINYTELPVQLSDGESVSLRQPLYSISNLGYGALHPETQYSPRIAPPMIGLGLLEAIDEQDLLQLADPQDRNADGISGRVNNVWNIKTQSVTIGRFGWKAGAPSLEQQNNAALSGDLGIGSWMHPHPAGDCTQRQVDCLKQPHGNTLAQGNLEASKTMTDLLLYYTRNLAVPMRKAAESRRALAGKQLFYKAGCTGCHTPKFITRSDADMPEQSNQLIWPYTDLLLHDMGEGLADNRPEFDANDREWRTPPLWGIGLTKVVSGHSYFLHDGRARSLLEAILWHGGEAEAAKENVVNMNAKERNELIYFLETL